MNRSNTNRPGAGKTTPPCPDCGRTAVTADARSVLAGHARIHHASTCPIHVASLELLDADLEWLRDHPGPGEGLLLRAMARCEYDDLATALGRRVPRSQRRRWDVAVTPYGGGVCRQYAYDQRVVAVQIDRPDQAGAA